MAATLNVDLSRLASLVIEYPVIMLGCVQGIAHPDKTYGPALVQTVADADPENPAAHAAVTENVEALRTSFDTVYPSVVLGRVQAYALHPERVYGPSPVHAATSADPS